MFTLRFSDEEINPKGQPKVLGLTRVPELQRKTMYGFYAAGQTFQRLLMSLWGFYGNDCSSVLEYISVGPSERATWQYLLGCQMPDHSTSSPRVHGIPEKCLPACLRKHGRDVNEIRKQLKLIRGQFPTSHHFICKYVCF